MLLDDTQTVAGVVAANLGLDLVSGERRVDAALGRALDEVEQATALSRLLAVQVFAAGGREGVLVGLGGRLDLGLVYALGVCQVSFEGRAVGPLT